MGWDPLQYLSLTGDDLRITRAVLERQQKIQDERLKGILESHATMVASRLAEILAKAFKKK